MQPINMIMHFVLDVFQMTAITFFSEINHDHINGLYPFWDNLHECVQITVFQIGILEII